MYQKIIDTIFSYIFGAFLLLILNRRLLLWIGKVFPAVIRISVIELIKNSKIQ